MKNLLCLVLAVASFLFISPVSADDIVNSTLGGNASFPGEFEIGWNGGGGTATLFVRTAYRFSIGAWGVTMPDKNGNWGARCVIRGVETSKPSDPTSCSGFTTRNGATMHESTSIVTGGPCLIGGIADVGATHSDFNASLSYTGGLILSENETFTEFPDSTNAYATGLTDFFITLDVTGGPLTSGKPSVMSSMPDPSEYVSNGSYILTTTDGVADNSNIVVGSAGVFEFNPASATSASVAISSQTVAPVPEPSTLALLGAASAILAGFIRRNRRK